MSIVAGTSAAMMAGMLVWLTTKKGNVVSLSYTEYLKLDSLLSLQFPTSEDENNNETLFIITHQVSELWFKQMLLELETVQKALENNEAYLVVDTLKRISLILKTIIHQIDVLETMQPQTFNKFRTRLDTASGFQSVQFHSVEYVLGKRPVLPSVNREPGPSVWDSFLRYLSNNGNEIPERLLNRDFSQPIPESKEVQAIIYQAYQGESMLKYLCEQLIELDEALQEWRYRHVKMVERTIGFKEGTGGSLGVEYLKRSLFSPLFPDLWKIRNAF
ncbi:tryptophan 2,3-dioxygenase [Pseudomonadota bacterium]